MRIFITGGTGLIGRALCQYWTAQGHEVWVLSRTPERVPTLCYGAQGIAQLQAFDRNLQLDAVVNLAGAPIGDRRWTALQRDLLWHSRVDLTRTLVGWMGLQHQAPKVLLSASAVGWYGDQGDTLLDEYSPAGAADFGSRLCVAWEQEAERAGACYVRVAKVRIAPVLAPRDGILGRLMQPFRLGLGGRLGSGRQWMPWIHIDDLVGLFDHLLRHDDCSGAYNACSPGVVRNSDFTQILAGALGRPALLPVPALALRLVLGEMSTLLLGSQHLLPRRTHEAGFTWHHPTLNSALTQLVHT